MWQAILAFFKAWSSTNEVIVKTLPSEKVNDERFEIKKVTLSEAQVKNIADKRNRLADEMFGDLVGHPEISVADKVNFEAVQLSDGEKLILIEILTDRLNSSSRYNRLKNKKSKFKL